MFHGKKLLASFLVFLLLPCSNSIDTIAINTPLKDGDVLVSQGESFALGFFSPTNSTTNRYVGVWYNKVSEQTVVWVLNRDSPINDTSGILSINTNGNLALLHQNLNVLIWSTNFSETTNTSSTQLLNSGNLVLYHSKKIVAWQSFDYPTNTMLPSMKLGFDKRTGINRFLTSWKSAEDPGAGEYSYKMDISGLPQLFLHKSLAPVWRSGPWNGLRWSGVPEMTQNFIINGSYIDNQDEISVKYVLKDPSIFLLLKVTEFGSAEWDMWHENPGKLVEFCSSPKDKCDNYGHCGAFGKCDPNNNTFQCACLPGYEPKSARDWYLKDGSAGCVRKRGRQECGNGDGFMKLDGVKLPDTSKSTHVDKSLGMKACEEFCLRNCTCVGYTSADISKGEGGRGCVSWHGEMIDIKQFTNGGQDLYIRVDAAELAQYPRKNKRFNGKQLVEITIASITIVVVLLFLAYWVVWMKKRGSTLRTGRREQDEQFTPRATSISFIGSPSGKGVDESGTNADLPFFPLGTIVAATNNFSLTNKLGEGGFGSVYKGRLHNGQKVAIKRLSDNSGQGMQEFKNEATVIAKLQHRNLVRLLGYCVEKEEKVLIYEYMPNKGLNSFIFDKEKGLLLDWRKRFEITLGICRGMLYLHQDSRLRIIHRDLKASNVLLDASMNPKISDFGMARIFGREQMDETTNRVVGTYGYMAPEYAMEGLFSIKSDVFSFGVLLLEIISGIKNSSYYRENSVNLIGHVWDLWEKGGALEIVDSAMGESYNEHEVKRCIHIGLLCVQESAVDRPTMSEVAFMLCHETSLASPLQPAFIFKKEKFGPDSSSTSTGAIFVCDESITWTEGRSNLWKYHKIYSIV